MATLITSPWSTGRRFRVKVEGISAEQAKLTASDGVTGDYFGCSVAVSSDGNTAVIGAYYDDGGKGSAYVFTRSGSSWTQQAKLTASDRAANNYFGWSVSLSGDGNTAVIGAYYDDGGKGSAYVFTRSGSSWTQQAKLTASDRTASDYFGWSVSLSGDGNTAVIGADHGSDNSGSVYVFTRSGSSWTQQAKLIVSDRVVSDSFGYSVAVSGDGNTAVIGAYADDDKGSDSGSAYVFVRSGSSWTQQAKLTASDGVSDDRFGWSVSLSGDGITAMIGADDDNSRGSAYVFTRSGSSWTQQAKLTASDGASNDRFGWSVSLSGDGITAMIGAYGYDNTRGSAYVFTRVGTIWTQRAKLTASDGAINDLFGHSVAISGDGNTAVIGADIDDDRGSSSGSAYIFV